MIELLDLLIEPDNERLQTNESNYAEIESQPNQDEPLAKYLYTKQNLWYIYEQQSNFVTEIRSRLNKFLSTLNNVLENKYDKK